MVLPITSVYAAALAFYFVAFAFHVSFVRARTEVRLGDGGNATMLVAIRRHGNLAEFLPLALVMMALGEAGGLDPFWVHTGGIFLVIGRLVHPFGITEDGGPIAARVVGQLSTYAAILLPAVFVLSSALI